MLNVVFCCWCGSLCVAVWCLLFADDGCLLSFVVRWVLIVVLRERFAVCWLLFVDWYELFAVCCWVLVVCRSMLDVC